MPAPVSPRKSTADWIGAAFRAIAERGLAAVAVESLARELRVTKGSFYWHFKDRGALLKAALRRWEHGQTEAIITYLEPIRDPRERLTLLLKGTLQQRKPALELAILRAADHPLVRPVLRRVSARRIGYLEQCYLKLGLPPEEARRRALLAYTAYVGFLHLTHEAPERLPSEAELSAYRRHVVAALVPEGRRPRRRPARRGRL